MNSKENSKWLQWLTMFGAHKEISKELDKIMNFLVMLDERDIEWYPKRKDVFNAFSFPKLEDIKVLVMGQDPYHNKGSATGKCFQDGLYEETGEKPRPSLRNMMKHLDRDIDFENTAKQGVLWLNTALTVEKKIANSHKDLWETFSKLLIQHINDNVNDVVWVLMGANALKLKELITNETHKFIITSHPSPFSWKRGLKEYPSFESTNIFEEVNKLIATPIKWTKEIL